MHALAKIRPALALLLGALCLLSGMGSQWEQMAHYTALSNRQRMILAGFSEAAPDAALPNSKRLLIIDRSGSTSNTWMLRGLEMRNALTWLYGAEVSPLVCTEPGLLFSSFRTDPSGRPGRCVESAAGWNIGQGLAEPIHPTLSDIRLPVYLGQFGHPAARNRTGWTRGGFDTYTGLTTLIFCHRALGKHARLLARVRLHVPATRCGLVVVSLRFR